MAQSTSIGTSAENTPAVCDLLDSITSIDGLSQELLSKIVSIARLALLRLETPSPLQAQDVANALRVIRDQADDLMNLVNCEAEKFGANFK